MLRPQPTRRGPFDSCEHAVNTRTASTTSLTGPRASGRGRSYRHRRAGAYEILTGSRTLTGGGTVGVAPDKQGHCHVHLEIERAEVED